VNKQNIDEWRAEIDNIDKELVRLLDRRAELVKAIGTAKKKSRLAIRDVDRERKVVGKALSASNGSFPPEALRKLFIWLLDVCVTIERKQL
jgi:chorismate mutase